jgi:hypothetical protein
MMQRLKTSLNVRVLYVLMALAAAGMILACAGNDESTFVRGDEVPGIDNPAMSTGLDKVDLEKLFKENLDHMMGSRFFREASRKVPAGTVAIFPFKNETSEHVGPQLQALLSDVETELVNDGTFDVISHENQRALLDELKIQQSSLYDQSRAVDFGRRLGVHYFITGKVYDSAERTSDVRRVQYFVFMQAISVETGKIEWQNKAELTKALVPLD